MSRFAGQRVVITGGSQGIGRACAELFAAEGAEVIATYIGDEGAAAATATAIGAAGGMIRMIRSDLGKRADNDRLWDEVGAGTDVLVLNAAFQRKALPEETDLDLLAQTFDINVIGNFQLAKRFIADRRTAKKPGAMVVQSSNQGEFVNPTGFAYALSKAALNHMVRHLATSVVGDRIRINGILLGWFNTDGERAFYSAEQIQAQAAKSIPMGRAGDPMEAARVTAFLASSESSYITGTLLRADGGFALAPDLST
jgi:NAD(P)-dependent dehydrogenase (short-subunit alcohol dehydrogenase family)